jgi:hypothetical protein
MHTHSKTALAVVFSVLTVLAFTASPVVAAEHVHTSGDAVDLYADQDTLVGNVTVSDDGTNLTVVYQVMDGYVITETHLAVGDVPQTKKGNPKVGNFAYSGTHDSVSTVTYVVPLADVDTSGGELVVAAHAVVVAVGGEGAGSPQWASNVDAYEQGVFKNGNEITDPDRTDPTAALGTPELTLAAGTFYSLGFAYDEASGELVPGNDYDGGADLPDNAFLAVSFDNPVYNGPGDEDIVVSESTFNRDSYPKEQAEVFVYHDGEWVQAGTFVSNKDDVSGPGTGAVAIPDGIQYADAVMLVDNTDPSIHGGTADGYDVDGIGASYTYLGEETAWADGDRFTERGSWATYFVYQLSDE